MAARDVQEVLMAARDVQEFLWAADADAHKHSPETWLRILQKRFDKLRELDTTQPHWQVEFRKRVLQLGAVSVRILAHRLAGQEAEHRPYGGVVPEIAARAHVEILPALVEDVLREADVALGEVDAIAATAGPGLIGGVMVGLVTAKGLALASGKPLIALNHLEGHALSPMLSQPHVLADLLLGL